MHSALVSFEEVSPSHQPMSWLLPSNWPDVRAQWALTAVKMLQNTQTCLLLWRSTKVCHHMWLRTQNYVPTCTFQHLVVMRVWPEHQGCHSLQLQRDHEVSLCKAAADLAPDRLHTSKDNQCQHQGNVLFQLTRLYWFACRTPCPRMVPNDISKAASKNHFLNNQPLGPTGTALDSKHSSFREPVQTDLKRRRMSFRPPVRLEVQEE